MRSRWLPRLFVLAHLTALWRLLTRPAAVVRGSCSTPCRLGDECACYHEGWGDAVEHRYPVDDMLLGDVVQRNGRGAAGYSVLGRIPWDPPTVLPPIPERTARSVLHDEAAACGWEQVARDAVAVDEDAVAAALREAGWKCEPR